MKTQKYYRSKLKTACAQKDFDFLQLLLSRHPDKLQATQFRKRKKWWFKSQGKWKRFPVGVCIRGFVDHRGRVIQAARAAVRRQILKFRKQTPPFCAISGQHLTKKNLHVDHHFERTPFQSLLERWRAGRPWESFKIRFSRNRWRLEPQEARSWCTFHRRHAELRVIHKKFNLKGASL